ncbi:MAG: hypothetical protein HC772_04575 [Leptolyngbyaceae cyanobacterium CRU_2_3]|nr:hypothetical protein [Leptolyngbyaceae cyanobacterium CRU_2_3]
MCCIIIAGEQNTLAEPNKICAYNPDSGIPNPLGMRAYITITEDKGDTTFLFEQFPSPVGGEAQATIASSRELIFYGVSLEGARTLMLQNPAYYSELVGYDSPEGFEPVNAVLACR